MDLGPFSHSLSRLEFRISVNIEIEREKRESEKEREREREESEFQYPRRKTTQALYFFSRQSSARFLIEASYSSSSLGAVRIEKMCEAAAPAPQRPSPRIWLLSGQWKKLARAKSDAAFGTASRRPAAALPTT